MAYILVRVQEGRAVNEGMDMKVYVASKSSNPRFALMEGNIIEVCYGVEPEGHAKSYAKEHVRDTDGPAWVYEVDLTAVVGYKISKEVVAVVPAKP